MKRRNWRNSRLSRELEDLGAELGQGQVRWESPWQQPQGHGHWPGIPLPDAGTAAAPAAGQAAEVCGRHWRVWRPTLAPGWRPGEVGAPQDCGHGESGGCSCPSPRRPCPAKHRSAALLGPCALAVQPAPRGSGCGPAGQSCWGPTAGLLCRLGRPGAVPDPAGLGIGCEGQAAVLERPGCLWSAACWAAPSGGCQCLCRHCGHQGGRSGLRRLRSRCPPSSGASGEWGAADPGAWAGSQSPPLCFVK